MNKYLDQQQLAELNIKAANYEYLVMSGQMKRQEVNNLIAEEIETYARANGYYLQNRILRETSDGVIRATNNTNFYFGSYYHSRAFNAGADAFHDSSILRSQAGSAAENYKQSAFDTKLQPWRESLNSINMLFHGIGSGLDSFTNFQNGRYNRGRPYFMDYDEYYDDNRGRSSSFSRRYRK